MNICISIGHGKSAKGGYDSNGQGTILQYVPSQLVGIYFEEATQS